MMLCLSACSTEGSMTPMVGAGTAAGAADIWAVDVSGAEPERADEIRDCVLERLIGSSLAQHVVLPGMPADRRLAISVIRVRYVSPGERMLLGAFAGRNVVEATETLSDPRHPSAPPIKVFRIDAESAAHPLAGVTSFEDALKQFADRTMDGLRG